MGAMGIPIGGPGNPAGCACAPVGWPTKSPKSKSPAPAALGAAGAPKSRGAAWADAAGAAELLKRSITPNWPCGWGGDGVTAAFGLKKSSSPPPCSSKLPPMSAVSSRSPCAARLPPFGSNPKSSSSSSGVLLLALRSSSSSSSSSWCRLLRGALSSDRSSLRSPPASAAPLPLGLLPSVPSLRCCLSYRTSRTSRDLLASSFCFFSSLNRASKFDFEMLLASILKPPSDGLLALPPSMVLLLRPPNFSRWALASSRACLSASLLPIISDMALAFSRTAEPLSLPSSEYEKRSSRRTVYCSPRQSSTVRSVPFLRR
mmetsp:Transcript_43581/g.79378  ORF Transcript_43581/g.79378 Transcript_43581/m.79378 type:complete len:316 (-) Transcript_43581:430-1377(-)